MTRPPRAGVAVPPAHRELSPVAFGRVRAGVFAPVTDVVERVTGRPARTLAQFLADAGPELRGP